MSGPVPIGSATRRVTLPGPVVLESGARLESVTVAYRTWGRLDSAGNNGVLVCHPLTASADADRWWPGMIGPGRSLDPDRDFIVCANVLGSCHGTTGPAEIRPGGGAPWGPDFPAVTIRDMVAVETRLLDLLGVRRLGLVIGGSMGGMQALEWAATAPDRLEAAAVIACGARHSPWCIALSEAQRAAIRADADWNDGRYSPARPPRRGLAAARMMAMCTYRTPAVFDRRFGRVRTPGGIFEAEGYVRYHGRRLVEGFDANAYVTLTRAMDTHDVGRDRGGCRRVLDTIDLPVLVVSIDSDLLYPPAEQRRLATSIPGARLVRLNSPHGHDAFLIDTGDLDGLVAAFRSFPASRRRRAAG